MCVMFLLWNNVAVWGRQRQLGGHPAGRFSLSKGTQHPLSYTVHFPFRISHCSVWAADLPVTMLWAQYKKELALDPYLYSVFSCFHVWLLLTLANSWNGTPDPRATQSIIAGVCFLANS